MKKSYAIYFLSLIIYFITFQFNSLAEKANCSGYLDPKFNVSGDYTNIDYDFGRGVSLGVDSCLDKDDYKVYKKLYDENYAFQKYNNPDKKAKHKVRTQIVQFMSLTRDNPDVKCKEGKSKGIVCSWPTGRGTDQELKLDALNVDLVNNHLDKAVMTSHEMAAVEADEKEKSDQAAADAQASEDQKNQLEKLKKENADLKNQNDKLKANVEKLVDEVKYFTETSCPVQTAQSMSTADASIEQYASTYSTQAVATGYEAVFVKDQRNKTDLAKQKARNRTPASAN